MESYKAGIIGCGNIARAHANAYKKIPTVEIITAAELDTDRRNKFAKDFELSTFYENYTEMLDIVIKNELFYWSILRLTCYSK